MLNVEIRLKKILFCFWWAYNFETNKLWTVSSHSCCHIVVNHYRIICFGTHFSFLLTSEAECLQTVSVWDVRACFLFLLSPKFKKSNHESFSLTAVFLFFISVPVLQQTDCYHVYKKELEKSDNPLWATLGKRWEEELPFDRNKPPAESGSRRGNHWSKLVLGWRESVDRKSN